LVEWGSKHVGFQKMACCPPYNLTTTTKTFPYYGHAHILNHVNQLYINNYK